MSMRCPAATVSIARWVSGRRPTPKRAIVTVAEGQRIDIFGGPVS